MRKILSLIFSILLLYSPCFANDTITLTPSTTYQTWRGLGGNVFHNPLPNTGCPTLSNDNLQNIYKWLAIDQGINFLRLQIFGGLNVEGATNDNTLANPSNGIATYADSVNWTPFSSALSANFNIGSGCQDTVKNWTQRANYFRQYMIGRNIVPKSFASFFFMRDTTGTDSANMEAWYKNTTTSGAAQSDACASDEFIEMWAASAHYLHDNSAVSAIPKFWLDAVEDNEPDTTGTGNFFQSESNSNGCANNSYFGNMATSFHIRRGLEGFPTLFMGPTPSNGGDVTTDITQINNTSGAFANIGIVSWHAYTTPLWSTLLSDLVTSSDTGQLQETASTEGPSSSADSSFTGGLTKMLTPAGPFDAITNGHISYFGSINVLSFPSSAGCPTTLSGGGYGLCIELDASTFYLNPSYYAWRQFSHFVRPGYVQMKSSATGGGSILVNAWIRPDGTYVVVFIKINAAANVTITGLHNKLHDIFQMDASKCLTGTNTTVFAQCNPPTVSTGTPSGGSLTLSSVPTNSVWTISERPALPQP